MFCYQCEQTRNGAGCFAAGVCGKEPEVAALQDLTVHALEGVGMYAHRARRFGAVDHSIDVFVIEALFHTLTNVNFDADRFDILLHQIGDARQRAAKLYVDAAEAAGETPETLEGPALWEPSSMAEMVAEAETVSILLRRERVDADVAATQELLTYGLKGLAAYAHHAVVLGQEDPAIFAFVHEALDALTRDLPLGDLLGLCLRTGEVNLRAMELLDSANVGAFGSPQPTAVRIHPRRGKAILVSGHDLADLGVLLDQTDGMGIDVYTHGEMLPAHGYPGLKGHPQLAGNYGGAWQNQTVEFAAFPGPILMTTNCLQQPHPTYKDRIYTAGPVGWPDVKHISDRDFTPIIEAALAAPGFKDEGSDETILVGFGRDAVLGVADQVIEAVKSGAVKHFFLIGGCDGARSGRNYFSEFAAQVPDDSIILTLGCGKYRFNKQDFGTVAGLPRLLDIGQCNDAYSAIRIAGALAGAFGCGVNNLPLSLILSWYEQKAVAVLLTLLHLGIRNIKIGPTLPAFVTPKVLGILVDNYAIAPISTAKQDLAEILAVA
ncbi:MAG: hydroxylamine reductase [Capsulimonadaceae bacterium]